MSEWVNEPTLSNNPPQNNWPNMNGDVLTMDRNSIGIFIDTGKNLWGSWVLQPPHLTASNCRFPMGSLTHHVAPGGMQDVGNRGARKWFYLATDDLGTTGTHWMSPLGRPGMPRSPTAIIVLCSTKNHPTIKWDNQGRTHEGNAHGSSILPANTSHDSHSRTGRCLVQGRVT